MPLVGLLIGRQRRHSVVVRGRRHHERCVVLGWPAGWTALCDWSSRQCDGGAAVLQLGESSSCTGGGGGMWRVLGVNCACCGCVCVCVLVVQGCTLQISGLNLVSIVQSVCGVALVLA